MWLGQIAFKYMLATLTIPFVYLIKERDRPVVVALGGQAAE